MFVRYLRQKLKTILLIIGCLIIQGIVLFLYRLDIAAISYGLLLCSVFVGLFIAVDFAYFRNKSLNLVDCIGNPNLSMQNLPKAVEFYEDEYQKIIQSLIESKNDLEFALNNTITDNTEYFTMWVHQIKTPIAAMRLVLQTSQYEDKGEIEEQLFKIEQYVDMVLQYLRMNEPNRDFLFRRFDSDEIIKQAVRKFSKSFIRKKISLNYEPVHITCVSDEKWLSFVIEQILSNAIKYTPEHGIISITKEFNTLVIRDSGIGISREDLPRIFEKGYTGYNGRNNKKSTGIGLYLCKTICDKLGHTLVIDSTVNEGTVVKIGLDTILTKA
ncbi:sensor histidine kinase [Anaerorhabdus furcosa]|uniref:histidine kinase n=1 Tax=Anaerorhabdus furcosa TaxID=118967 RepID=A0A1T4KD23_9FIRM|nr:sensor histidine kinase [Anaerorhabdus furcosa]SJZ40334.1 hypothetical protein SAMN02745191_0485 [Anaerorhabdus furcosa]